MTTQTKDPVTNGIHMEALNETVEALREQPELAACRFYARNRWDAGARNTTELTHFYCAREDHEHPHTFHLHADEPPALGGDESAANPAEHLLNALASCMTTSLVAHATVRGIRINALESHIEGDIDLRGFLGLDDNVPKGFSNIRIAFTVDADEADTERLKELARFSPIFHSLNDGTPVEVRVNGK